MVEKTKVRSPTVSTSGPTSGRSPNAALVSAAPVSPFVHSPELTSTRPVMAHTTTVSQKVPVEETSAWRSEEHTSELQSLAYLVCRLLLEKKKKVDSTVSAKSSYIARSDRYI